ncbi:MAG: UDP-2-acetamido-2-deoxy-ribo-hexuluronate aminotransferase [Methylophilaceae bacterium]|jgi:UDP-2-acetamido-2-deoxy-ribo-hexuluronate aminotransferase
MENCQSVNNMHIDFANLQLQYQKYKVDIDANIQAILNKSNYIMGEEVLGLERELEKFSGVKHALTCSSGTDALLLAMMALDIQPGDEIITTPFTFISTAETIALMKAKPVFVDIEEDTFNIDASLIKDAITSKTKAIMPVSLFGQSSDINTIQAIADDFSLKVIIDGAQSFGSIYNGKTDSNLGDISITSFFPAKPLGCYGDGGAVFTNDDEYAEKIKMMRVHGQDKRYHHKYVGLGGRLDTIQAAILLAKLPHYSQELKLREKVAQYYTISLSSNFKTPVIKPNRYSSWAQYTIKSCDRDNIQSKLKSYNIPTSVYYPIPLHLQKCFEYLNYKQGDFPISEKSSKEVISLPINSFITKIEQEYIISNLLEC